MSPKNPNPRPAIEPKPQRAPQRKPKKPAKSPKALAAKAMQQGDVAARKLKLGDVAIGPDGKIIRPPKILGEGVEDKFKIITK